MKALGPDVFNIPFSRKKNLAVCARAVFCTAFLRGRLWAGGRRVGRESVEEEKEALQTHLSPSLPFTIQGSKLCLLSLSSPSSLLPLPSSSPLSSFNRGDEGLRDPFFLFLVSFGKLDF